MRSEVLLAAALAMTAAGNAPGCGDFEGDLCVDAGEAKRGLVIMREATIEFEDAEQGLRLVVRDRASGSLTELELPKPPR